MNGYANFSAPNFSVSIWDEQYNSGDYVSGVHISDPGGSGGWSLTCIDGDCFTAGTQVVVGVEFDENDVFVQYVTVNIEDIKVGDLVYSYDTITGEVSQQEVTAIFVREIDHINYLTIVDETGNEQVIEVTDGHPFWVVTDDPDFSRAANNDSDGLYHGDLEPGLNGYWVEAKDLREGDVLLGANGELSTVVSNERVEFPEGITVYNFTVEGNHDYFVIAQADEYGQTCVLAHNAAGEQSGWQTFKDWFWIMVGYVQPSSTSALTTGTIAPLQATAVALQPDNIENYFRYQRDRAIEGTPDYDYWQERLDRCRGMRNNR